jgi:hypothetical protein
MNRKIILSFILILMFCSFLASLHQVKALTNTSLTLTNPSIGSEGCLAAKQAYVFRAVVTSDFDFTEVKLTLAYGYQNIEVKAYYDAGDYHFVEVSDPNNYITLFGSFVMLGPPLAIQFDFSIIFSWTYPDQSSHSCLLTSVDMNDDADSDLYSNVYYVKTSLAFSSLAVSPTFCSQGAALGFGGKLYYSGTSVAPPNGNYNVQVLLSGLTVGTDITLVAGSFSLSANAPGSAGTYTYTCQASYSSAGTFPSVSVGYTLTISTSTGGTTSPSPGSYLKNSGVTQQVSAINNSGYQFDHWLLDSSTLNYSNPCSVYMDASHSIQAFFTLVTPPPSDTTAPTFGTITGNTTGAGLAVTLSCAVADDVAVSSYKFEWNNTGIPVNQTAVSASGASLTATFSGTWNTSIGNIVAVKVYANDSSNNWNGTGVTYFLLTDPTGPTFSNIGINTTVAGVAVSFSALAADNMNVSGYIFQSNITGIMQNTTWTAFPIYFTLTSAWINVTETLPGIVDSIVQWQFLVNDSVDNWAACDLQNTTLTSPPPSTVAQITFYVGGGGLLYVNGGLISDNSTLNCTIGSSLSFAAVPLSGYVFSGFLWTNSTISASPATYNVSADDSVYVYFTASSSPPPGPGPGPGPSPSIQVTITAHVSASPGQDTFFDLTVTWQTGITNLTVTSISPGGSFSSWITLVDALPKTGGSGSMTVSLKCTPSWDANLGQANIPVTVGVQPVGGSASSASGTIVVTVVSGQEMGLIPEVLTIIFLIVAIVVGLYGYIRRIHH